MTKKLVENHKNILKISDLRDYLMLRKYQNVTSWIISLPDVSVWLILEKDEKQWYLKVFVNHQDIIFNRTDTNNYWYVIHLETTKCNYGWFRWWFICPWSWKKCSHLYFTDHWKLYSRKYLNLTYLDQYLSKNQREFDEMNWKYDDKILALKSKIKYKQRKGLKTKKQSLLEKYENKSKTKEEKSAYFNKKIDKIYLKFSKFQ